MGSLTDVREELAAKRRDLHNLFQEAGPDLDMSKVTSIYGTSEEKAAEIRSRNDALTALGQEHDRLALLDMIAKQNEVEHKRLNEAGSSLALGGGDGGAGKATGQLQPRHLRELIAGNKGYKAFRDGTQRSVTIDIPAADFKTLVTLATINRPNERRDVVAMALEERTVADLMLEGATDANTLEYFEETTFTNNAATVGESAQGAPATKPESAMGFTLRQESIRKIAHFIPATSEALADVSFLESTIRGRLAFGVQRAEEVQLLSGDGNAPNLRGLLNRTGIQTQAKGADPTPDAIYKAMQLIRGAAGAGFAEPSAVVMHPNDWTDIKLLRTADGIYIWGNPSDEGPDRIWGLPVRQTTAMTQNTALVGAFRPHAEVIRRQGIQITLSTEHSTFFVENKVAILAEERLGLAVYRAAAFATVTGI
jgi:HK97 family phage major capsid protein